MSTPSIGMVVGSLRRESLNRRLAEAIARMAPPDWRFEILPIGDLPLYDQDHDGDPAPAVQRFKQQVREAAGIVFVTPEYNRSLPGVLKNAIDHASRPYGQSVWAGKPVGIAGASIGAIGTACAQQHLRSIVSYLAMPLLPQPEVYLHAKAGFFDANGEIADLGTRAFVKTWVDAYVGWVEQHAGR